MKKISILFAFFLINIAYSETIDLRKAIQLSLNNQPGIIASNYEKLSAESMRKSFLSNFFPTIQTNIRYLTLDDPIVIDLNPIRSAMIQIQANNIVEYKNIYSYLQTGSFLPASVKPLIYNAAVDTLNKLLPEFKETIKNKNYWSGQIQITQPIWTWGKILSAYNISKLDEKIAQENLTLQQQKIVNEVIETYFSILFLKEYYNLKIETIKNLEKHAETTKKMLDNELIPKIEYFRILTSLENEKAELVKIKNDLNVSLQYLKTKINYNFDDLSDSLKFPEKIYDLSFYLNDLEKKQSYLKILENNENKIEYKKNIDRANWLPQIYGFGNIEIFTNDLSTLEPKWTVGLGMKWDILNGIDKYYQIKSDGYIKNQLKYKKKELYDNIKIGIEKAYNEMINAKANYEAQEKTLTLAEENLKLNTKKFETGLGTSLELNDAEIMLEKVKISRLKEIYYFNKSFAQLLFLSSHILEIVDYY